MPKSTTISKSKSITIFLISLIAISLILLIAIKRKFINILIAIIKLAKTLISILSKISSDNNRTLKAFISNAKNRNNKNKNKNQRS